MLIFIPQNGSGICQWRKSVEVFQSQFYPLKINHSLTVFAQSWAELNVVYVLKKASKKVNICLWNRSESLALWSGPKSLCSRLLFECPLAVQSASPQLVKYNIIVATIFMIFHTQIHTKKCSKNGFLTLQGTMSHRPLTNTSSLKITAAYCGCISV
jgi:hypothetical protein